MNYKFSSDRIITLVIYLFSWLFLPFPPHVNDSYFQHWKVIAETTSLEVSENRLQLWLYSSEI